MHEHIDSWKNSREAFSQQLDVNIRELNLGFPPHWQHFVDYMDSLEIDRVIDVGCGAGVYGFISKKLNKNYIGYDYSEHAINIARRTWQPELTKQMPNNDNTMDFYCKDYKDLTEAEQPDTDLLVANAICDVLPNGDECLEFLLKLKYRHLLIQRMSLIEESEYSEEYQAYNITTYKFHHNKNKTISMIQDMGYSVNTVHLYETTHDLEITLNG